MIPKLPPKPDGGIKSLPGYGIWSSMKNRCYNKKVHAYPWYGAKGVTVCERWRTSFMNFFEDMGPRPHGYWLDRINHNGNYEPANCRWATLKEQGRNKSSNHWVEFNGIKMTLAQACEETNINYSAVWYVMKSKKMLFEQAREYVVEREKKRRSRSDLLAHWRVEYVFYNAILDRIYIGSVYDVEFPSYHPQEHIILLGVL